TKNRVSSTRKLSTCLLSSAVATTPLRSVLSVTVLTKPISTSLYLILVLPASRPSAVLKLMVMTGPRSRMARTASQPPTSTATMGTIQMSCGVKRRRGAATASGRSGNPGSGLSAMCLYRIPDQARIEGLGGEHGQHDHRPEGDGPGAGLDAHEPSELDECGEDGRHVDVDHGPATHELEHAIETRPLLRSEGRAALHGDEE